MPRNGELGMGLAGGTRGSWQCLVVLVREERYIGTVKKNFLVEVSVLFLCQESLYPSLLLMRMRS